MESSRKHVTSESLAGRWGEQAATVGNITVQSRIQMSGLDKTRFLSKSRVYCVVLVECAPFVMKCKFEEGDRVLEYGNS